LLRHSTERDNGQQDALSAHFWGRHKAAQTGEKKASKRDGSSQQMLRAETLMSELCRTANAIRAEPSAAGCG